MRTVLAMLVVSIAVGVAAPARAQVCTESQTDPGVARIATNGVTVTIHVANLVPKVNGVSCGFVAGAIEVVGGSGNDNVILNYVPPWFPVSMDLGAGTNNVSIYEAG